MADRVYASLDVGGHLATVEEAEGLVAMLVREDLARDERHAQSVLRESIERKRCAWIQDDQTNHGTFNHVEATVADTPGLCCLTKYAVGDNFPEGWNLLTHQDGEAQTFQIPTNDGDPCIDYRDIKGILDMPDATLAKVIRDKAAIIKLANEMPPLTASPAVAAWLRIFGGEVT